MTVPFHPNPFTTALVVVSVALIALPQLPARFPATGSDASFPRWTWIDRSNGPAPPAAAGTLLAYDSVANRFVLFGGWNGSVLNQTWVFDPVDTTWTELPLASSPSPRADAAFAFDSHSEEFVLFGGWGLYPNGTPFRYDDTWSFSLASHRWTELHPALSPSPRSDSAFAYDPVADRFVLYGGFSGSSYLGDLWVYQPGSDSWSEGPGSSFAPGMRSDGRMVYDSVDRRMVLFGGNDYSGPNLSFHHLDDTWLLDPTTLQWTRVFPLASPPARDYAFEGFDPRDDLVLLFGGYGNRVFLNDLWTFEVASYRWTPVPTTATPPARYAGGAAYDPVQDLFLVTTGLGESGLLNDTWTLIREEGASPGSGTAWLAVVPLGLVAAATVPLCLYLWWRGRNPR